MNVDPGPRSYQSLELTTSSAELKKRAILSAPDTNDQLQKQQHNITSTNQDNETPAVQLKRSVSLFNGFSIIVGIIVGSGIFVSPKGVLLDAGSVGVALIVWFLCGLLALFGSLCFAELGTSISASGGDYHYIRLAYGPLLSFLYLWVTFGVILPCSNAISALTFARYILEPFCSPPEESVRLLALAMLGLLTYINCASVNGAMRIQNGFTIAKVAALICVIVYGFIYMISGTALDQVSLVGEQASFWTGSQTSPFHLAQAFYAGFYTYAGWNSLNFVTEELKDPVRNMPRAIIMSIGFITLLYMFTNLAYFAVLTKEEILASDAIAVLFGKKVLGSAHLIMPIAVALSTMGSLNGGIFAGSRILMVGARQGQLFSVLRTIHANKLSPMASIITLGLLSSLYLITTKILSLIQYLILVEASFAALAVSTVLVLRHKMPHLDRPLRVPTMIPLLYLAFSFLMLSLPIWISPIEAMIGIVFTLAGVPIYYVTARWKQKPASYQRALDSFNLIIQKLTLSVDPDGTQQEVATTTKPTTANGESTK